MGGDEVRVRPRLRVGGVRQLRVIDAIGMPSMVSTNTNAATNKIAEHCAQLPTK